MCCSLGISCAVVIVFVIGRCFVVIKVWRNLLNCEIERNILQAFSFSNMSIKKYVLATNVYWSKHRSFSEIALWRIILYGKCSCFLGNTILETKCLQTSEFPKIDWITVAKNNYDTFSIFVCFANNPSQNIFWIRISFRNLFGGRPRHIAIIMI